VIWDEYCIEYLNARPTKHFQEAASPLLSAVHRSVRSASKKDWEWFVLALGDAQKKWFVVFALDAIGTLPKVLFMPMLRAAVYERNPSLNRKFVEPCIRCYGHLRVNEVLLDFFEKGTNFEKAGAANASYWALMPLAFKGSVPNFDGENAISESRSTRVALDDILLRQRCLFLQEFVSNTDIDVRRSLIPRLELKDPSVYPEHLRPLVDQAIQIARAHSDDYIHHRVEVQLDRDRLLKPLPRRD
jgi:hypothetical protein